MKVEVVASGEAMDEGRVVVAPGHGLIEGLAMGGAGTEELGGPDRRIVGSLSLDVPQVYVLVGVALADLGPGQALGDGWCERVSGAHLR